MERQSGVADSDTEVIDSLQVNKPFGTLFNLARRIVRDTIVEPAGKRVFCICIFTANVRKSETVVAIGKKALPAIRRALGNTGTRPFIRIDPSALREKVHQDASIGGISSSTFLFLVRILEFNTFVSGKQKDRVEFSASLNISFKASVGFMSNEIILRVKRERR
jgi:hypothetical protein